MRQGLYTGNQNDLTDIGDVGAIQVLDRGRKTSVSFPDLPKGSVVFSDVSGDGLGTCETDLLQPSCADSAASGSYPQAVKSSWRPAVIWL